MPAEPLPMMATFFLGTTFSCGSMVVIREISRLQIKKIAGVDKAFLRCLVGYRAIGSYGALDEVMRIVVIIARCGGYTGDQDIRPKQLSDKEGHETKKDIIQISIWCFGCFASMMLIPDCSSRVSMSLLSKHPGL